MTGVLILKPDREKSVRQGHPWIFSGAVERVVGKVAPGETVEIKTAAGEILGRGAYSPTSQISARMWTRTSDEIIDEGFFFYKLTQASKLRKSLVDLKDTNAYRLVHAESDDLPGVIVDVYDEVGVVQLLSEGAEYWRETLTELILKVSEIKSLYERSDVEVRKLEGLPFRTGQIAGKPVPDQIIINENGFQYIVDIVNGHKTGFYLDQRSNRLQVRSFVEGKVVLDCFCYTGGFSINALAGKARSITAVDDSGDALRVADQNLRLNSFRDDSITLIKGDVFQELRSFRDRALSFNVIILDPPKFAQTKAQVGRAARGYKDINLLAMKLLREAGTLVTFSCSGGITDDLFQKIVFSAALDAGIQMQIIGYLHQASDHPVALNFPEGSYLKGLILRRMN